MKSLCRKRATLRVVGFVIINTSRNYGSILSMGKQVVERVIAKTALSGGFWLSNLLRDASEDFRMVFRDGGEDLAVEFDASFLKLIDERAV